MLMMQFIVGLYKKEFHKDILLFICAQVLYSMYAYE